MKNNFFTNYLQLLFFSGCFSDMILISSNREAAKAASYYKTSPEETRFRTRISGGFS